MLTTSSRLKHVINSLYVISDVMISAIPIRLQHVIYPLVSGCIYILFSYTYYKMGGTGPGSTPYIYYDVNWKYPFTAGICCIGVLMCVVIAQVVFFGLYRLRMWIYDKVVSKHNVFGASDQEKMGVLRHSPKRDGSYQSTVPSSVDEMDIQEVLAY